MTANKKIMEKLNKRAIEIVQTIEPERILTSGEMRDPIIGLTTYFLMAMTEHLFPRGKKIVDKTKIK